MALKICDGLNWHRGDQSEGTCTLMERALKIAVDLQVSDREHSPTVNAHDSICAGAIVSGNNNWSVKPGLKWDLTLRIESH